MKESCIEIMGLRCLLMVAVVEEEGGDDECFFGRERGRKKTSLIERGIKWYFHFEK